MPTTSRSPRASSLAIRWSSMVPTDSRMAPRYSSVRVARRARERARPLIPGPMPGPPRRGSSARVAGGTRSRAALAAAERTIFWDPAGLGLRDSRRYEPFPHFHPPAGRHLASHGGDPARRYRRLSLPAALGAAAGRLPNHSGADLLSGREPGGHDLGSHGAAGGAVRTDAGAQPDVLDELGGRLGHHTAVQPGGEPRCGGAGGSGRDQRRRQPPALRSSGAAHLRESQSG